MLNFSVDLGLLWLYVLLLVLTQTWLLGFDYRMRLAWMGLQLLLFVCLPLLPIAPFLCLSALLGASSLLPFALLVGALLWLCFFLWQRAVPWFERQGFQGRVRNLNERLVLSLGGSAMGWLCFSSVTQSFPRGFRLGLLVLLGVAVGQITGRLLRR